MDVVNDVTYQFNDHWIVGHWTMQDDPPRVLNVFKCINPNDDIQFGTYLVLVANGVWKKHGNRKNIIEEHMRLDPLTAQCVVYEMLEKYGASK